MFYSKRKLRDVIKEKFLTKKESKESNKENYSILFDKVKGEIINESSGFPLLMAFLSTFVFIPLYIFTDISTSAILTIVISVSIFIGIPMYWYRSIKNPYSDKYENKEKQSDKEKKEKSL